MPRGKSNDFKAIRAGPGPGLVKRVTGRRHPAQAPAIYGAESSTWIVAWRLQMRPREAGGRREYHLGSAQGTNKMNPISILAGCLLLATSMVAASAEPKAGVEARQPPSCGEWVVHRERSDTLALANASWLLGYLSGSAVATGKNFLPRIDNSSIFKWMDKYCQGNPLRDLRSGGDALAAELTGKGARK